MKKILCPVDFTGTSLNGLTYAFETAKRFGSELVLFHSVHVPVTNTENSALPEDLYDTEEKAREKLEQICEKMQPENHDRKINYYFVVKPGLAEDEILNIVGEMHIDMVIMGTKGARGIDKVFSTVSADIAAKAPCPVLIVPENFSYRPVKNIVYATDIHGDEETVVKYVVSFAKSTGAHIYFLNIQKDEGLNTGTLINYGTRMLDQPEYKDMSFHVIENRNVIEGINAFAEEKQAEMIVMAAKDKSLLQRLFTKSVTRQEAFSTQIPLLIMHKQHAYRFEG